MSTRSEARPNSLPDEVKYEIRQNVSSLDIAPIFILAHMRKQLETFFREGKVSNSTLYSLAFRFVHNGDPSKLDKLEYFFPEWDVPEDLVRAVSDPVAEYYASLEDDTRETSRYLLSAIEVGIADKMERSLRE